ncbi:Gfo/Idh/MocA family oxidoreductase [Candidatus Sumerlaeota bacterium]|nr:Gfo/Idh/MocA family oxidoreductase [Candidatus Sumerlaeota bacterium]
MEKKFKWGVIGTGKIAGRFADQVPQSQTGELYAVASRTREKAEMFAQKYNIPRFYGSYQELLEDPEVDIAYIATPHPQHAEWSIKAARAKKHILCEKPLTLNYTEAQKVIDEARKKDVFLMEAFHYRCHPQTKKLIELIKENVIGEVRVLQGAFSFNSPYGLEHRTLNHALAGGGVLDVGCYPVSMARLLAGIALGKDFEEPLEVKGCGKIGIQTRVDEYASACLKFPEGIMAEVSCGVTVQQENVFRVYGSKGRITVPTPWVVSLNGGTSKILVQMEGKEKPEEIEVTAERGLFAIEADTACHFIPQRQASPPAMSWEDSLCQMKTLDLWRASIGLAYDMEELG